MSVVLDEKFRLEVQNAQMGTDITILSLYLRVE